MGFTDRFHIIGDIYFRLAVDDRTFAFQNLDKNLIEVVDSAKPAMFLKICLNNVSKAAFSFKSGHLTKFNQIDHKVLFAAF